MINPGSYSLTAQILALKMTGQVGPRTFSILMAVYQTVSEIHLAEEAEFLEFPGIGPKRSQAIADAHKNLDKAQEIIENLEASDTSVVSRLDTEFPETLLELNDPPLLLFYRGKLPEFGLKRVAVIGSQNISADGIGDAVEFARQMAREGIGIVGGLARGNTSLAAEIARKGCLISEHLPDTPVSSGRLMSRNRLIVGLSHAVVVGEVSPESVGTIDTAQCCHELGKLLFLIIGKHNHHYDKLAEYGAIPLTNIDDYKMVYKSLV